jgi:hypothetical protein
MSNPPNPDSKFALIAEFWDFLKTRKKWWLGPIVFIMLLMSLLIVLTEGSAVAPFIYTLF